MYGLEGCKQVVPGVLACMTGIVLPVRIEVKVIIGTGNHPTPQLLTGEPSPLYLPPPQARIAYFSAIPGVHEISPRHNPANWCAR